MALLWFFQVFHFIEATPLLCVIEGFLNELSIFLMNNESLQAEMGDHNVDDNYVTALELYCLLKQCLLDMKHNWRAVMAVAFSLPTNVKYASKFSLESTVIIEKEVILCNCERLSTCYSAIVCTC